MFGISLGHLLILGIILLFVGPRKLPELGRSLGKTLKNFRDGLAGVQDAEFRKIDDKESGAAKSLEEQSKKS
jgi:sec-independent protein translocase protein TatA